MNHESVITGVIGVVGLLLVAALSALGLKRARIPYTVGLVVVGLVLGALVDRAPMLELLGEIELSPEIILFVFLPTLIFESAFNLNSRLLYQNLGSVLILAAPGLLLSTFLIGGVMSMVTPLSLIPALVFGALISATDPVAVVALFKELGAPKRLGILVEGESLFNDATAIVLFHILVALAAGGAVTATTVATGAVDFGRVFLGGLIVGGVIGYLLVRSVALAHDEPLVEVALSIVVAYAAFIVAEHYLHVSGVMATVGAGVVVGTYGIPRFTSATRTFLHHFWEYAAFAANGLIFLLVGLSIRLDGLVAYAGPIGWAIVIALAARGIVVFGLLPIVTRFADTRAVGREYRAVLWWGGLRGAVALALAYSLEPDFASRELIVALSVGVVLFTLLTGGLSMGRLIGWLGLDEPTLVERMARVQASAAAERAARERLRGLTSSGHYSESLLTELQEEYADREARTRADLDGLRAACSTAQFREALWLEALAVERAVYAELSDRGFISEPVRRELELAVDLERDLVANGQVPDMRPEAVPVEVRAGERIYQVLEWSMPRSGVVQRHRLRVLAARYEHDTAQVEASRRVSDELDSLAALAGADAEAVAEIRATYDRRRQAAMVRLDGTAEHFPEYAAAVQQRSARRIALDGEADAVRALAVRGSIPPSVVQAARQALEKSQRKLLRQPVDALAPKPEELLVRVPFFSDLDSDTFRQVVAKVVPRTVLQGETIIREGDPGRSMFMIARGVVAVSRLDADGRAVRLAALYPGDFFGEMAILSGERRNASVAALSSSQLYELSRRDVEELCQVCAGLKAALVAAHDERHRAQNGISAAPGD